MTDNDRQTTPTALREALIGRRIVEARGTDELVLDNGSIIRFASYGDCCAWADVERLSTVDHVITNLRIEEVDHDRGGGEYTWTVFALSSASVDTEIAHVVGNEGSGYYPFGVDISIDGHDLGGVNW